MLSANRRAFDVSKANRMKYSSGLLARPLPSEAASEAAGTQGCRSKRGVEGKWANTRGVLSPPANKPCCCSATVCELY